jgi:hypothetical protein
MNSLEFISQKNLSSAENIKNILLEQDEKINKINYDLKNINDTIIISKNIYSSITSWFWWIIPYKVKNYFYEDIDNLNATPINSSQIIYNDDILDNLNNLKNTSIEIGLLLDTQNENLNKINLGLDKINKKVAL